MSSQAVSSSRGAGGLWQRPSLVVARFVLRSHVKSGWIIGDVVFVWLLYAIFFLEFGGDVAYFYGTAGPGLSVLTVLSTMVMLTRSLNARMYLPLARLTSRGAYIRGIILASAFLRVPSFLLMLVLGGGIHLHNPGLGIEGATFLNMVPGAVGILVGTMVLVALTAVLWIPVATRRIQIGFLLWLVIVLYSNGGRGMLGEYLSYSWIPLAPLAACYNLGKVQGINGYSGVMLLVAVGYFVGLMVLAEYWLSKRDLILH